MKNRDTEVLMLATVGGVGGCTRVVGDLANLWRRDGLGVRLAFPDPGSVASTAAVDWLT